MARRGSGLVIAVCVLAAIGFCAAFFVLSVMSKSGDVGAPSRTAQPVPMPAPHSNSVASTAPAPNPALQKAGPPDPSMQDAAATAAENAAKAAADLAEK